MEIGKDILEWSVSAHSFFLLKEIKHKTRKITYLFPAVWTDSCCQSSGRQSRTQQAHGGPPSGMYSGQSLCHHPRKALAQWHNHPLGSRRSVQPASLQLPCTLQFHSQFESGSPQGALQKCRGNASVLTYGTYIVSFASAQNLVIWNTATYDVPYLTLGGDIHVGNSHQVLLYDTCNSHHEWWPLDKSEEQDPHQVWRPRWFSRLYSFLLWSDSYPA